MTSVAGNNSISDVWQGFEFAFVAINGFRKKIYFMFDRVLNTLLQFTLQYALDVYQLGVMTTCLHNLRNIFQYISNINIFQYKSSNTVHRQIRETLCLTYLQNNKRPNVSIDQMFLYTIIII